MESSESSSRRRVWSLAIALQPWRWTGSIHRTQPAAVVLTAAAAAAAAVETSNDEQRVRTQNRLEALAGAFNGRVAICARHLGTGEAYEIAPDATMPTASLIKVPILGATLQAVEDGSLEYNQPVQFSERNCLGQSNEFWGGNVPQKWEPYEIGNDIFARFRAGGEIELSKLITLMLSFSDNYASLCLQNLAGGGSRINSWLQDTAGCRITRVNSRTRGRVAEQSRWGWGQTTPREMMDLTVKLTRLDARDQGLLGLEARYEARRLLSRSFWAREGISVLPPTVAVASKQGAVDRSRSEVAVVCADPHAAHHNVYQGQAEYAYCVITADQADERWVADNDGNVLLREVASILWSRWGAAANADSIGQGLPSPTGRFALETG